MTTFGLWCLLGLVGYLVVAVLVKSMLSIQLPRAATVFGLAVAIHLSAWRFAVSHCRELLATEKPRFVFACFVAFWLLDESWKLVGRFASDDHSVTRNIAVTIVAAAIEYAIVAAVVYWTVPFAMRKYLGRAVA